MLMSLSPSTLTLRSRTCDHAAITSIQAHQAKAPFKSSMVGGTASCRQGSYQAWDLTIARTSGAVNLFLTMAPLELSLPPLPSESRVITNLRGHEVGDHSTPLEL
jgi:hypothetical protein